VVVAGRFGQPPTIKMARPELPLRRFLERTRVYYPGVELIVDAELSIGTDLYLQDHVLQKQKIFPAVLGLEAMAQVAMALTGSELPPLRKSSWPVQSQSLTISLLSSDFRCAMRVLILSLLAR
jgi:enediyne polyketide synthase